MRTLLLLLILSCIGCALQSPLYTSYLSGDCVDRAVQLRQELRSKGYEAQLILGLRGTKQGHCWVRYKRKDGVWEDLFNY